MIQKILELLNGTLLEKLNEPYQGEKEEKMLMQTQRLKNLFLL